MSLLDISTDAIQPEGLRPFDTLFGTEHRAIAIINCLFYTNSPTAPLLLSNISIPASFIHAKPTGSSVYCFYHDTNEETGLMMMATADPEAATQGKKHMLISINCCNFSGEENFTPSSSSMLAWSANLDLL